LAPSRLGPPAGSGWPLGGRGSRLRRNHAFPAAFRTLLVPPLWPPAGAACHGGVFVVGRGRLLVFPVHLGSGKKLFRDGAKPAALRHISTTTTGTGVVITTYQPDGPVRLGSYALDAA